MLMILVYFFLIIPLWMLRKKLSELRKVLSFPNYRKLFINYKKHILWTYLFIMMKIILINKKYIFVKTCQTLYRISKIRYLGSTFNKNMRWSPHVYNIVMRLHTITFKIYKLHLFLPVDTFHIIYLTFIKVIFNMDFWSGEV